MDQGLTIFERRKWLARVWSGGSSRESVVGTGFAIDHQHLVTCAHVVQDAGASGPGSRVYIDFPLLGHKGCWSVVLEDGWRSIPANTAPQSEGDTAILQIENTFPGVEPIPIRSYKTYDGLGFNAYGFPVPEGDVAHGKLGLRVGIEWIRVESDSNAMIEPGFSGAPIFVEDLQGAVAMVQTRKEGNGRVAFALPIATIASGSAIVAEALRGGIGPLSWIHRAPLSFATDILRFDTLLSKHASNFIGRKFLFAAIDRRLHDPTCAGGYIVVEGEPGIGKSAAIAQLASNRGYPYHFNIASDSAHSTEQFLRNICAQLIVRYELPYRIPPPGVANGSETLTSLLAESVASAIQKGEPGVVLLVDALDETAEPRSGVNRLSLPRELPAGVYIVVTIRKNVPLLITTDQVVGEITIDEASDENKADVKEYIEDFLEHHLDAMEAKLTAWNVSCAEFVATLVKQSEGNFMYLHHVLRDILSGNIVKASLDRLEQLPKGLHSYYARHWRIMEDRDRIRFRNLQRPILCVLAKAREPVNTELIAEWISESGMFDPVGPEDVDDVFKEWAQFIHKESEDPPRFRLYHKSFLDFLEKEVGLARYGKAIAQAMARKVNWEPGK